MQELRQGVHDIEEALAAYVEGWSEADPEKIALATLEGYEFYDPLIGRFSKGELPHYFALLRTHFSVATTHPCGEVGFALRGPMLGANNQDRRRYWREAPVLGLTGESEIIISPLGIGAESVAYDLNLASEALRNFSRNTGGPAVRRYQ